LAPSSFRRGKLSFKPRAVTRGYFVPLPLLFPKIFCKQNIFGNPIFFALKEDGKGAGGEYFIKLSLVINFLLLLLS